MKLAKFDTSYLYTNGVIDNAPISKLLVSEETWNQYFDWQLKHGKDNELYVFNSEFAAHVENVSERLYDVFFEMASIILLEHNKGNTEPFRRYFGQDVPEKFIDFAIESLLREDFAIYGRFDLAMDWVNEKIIGVYEFNSDTPGMLFESVYLQNETVSEYNRINKTNYDQYNVWLEHTTDYLAKHIPIGSKVACLCHLDLVEDATTVETISHAFPEHCDVRICDTRLMEIDIAKYADPVLTIGSDNFEPDYIYIMKPWEEMFEEGNVFFKELERFKDKVKFFEPPWRYFLGHKGLMVALSDLNKGCLFGIDYVDQDLESNVMSLFNEGVLLETVFELPKTGAWIGKPIGGRMSSGIKGYYNGELKESTDVTIDYKGTDRYVYQRLVETRVNSSKSAILCSWMSPWISDDKLMMGCAGFIVREFSNYGFINDIDNERFVGHLLENE